MADKYQAAGTACFLLSFLVGRTVFVYGSIQFPWIFLEIVAGLMALVLCVLGAIYIFLATQNISKYETLSSALFCFVVVYGPLFVGRKTLKKLLNSCSDPRKTQEKCLQGIIKVSKNTEYGVKMGFKNITSLKDFQSKHPLTSYSDYEQYIKRICKGETDILTAVEIDRLGLSSGTTGTIKCIPMNMDRYINNIFVLSAIMFDAFPDVQPMQKMIRLHKNAKLGRSEGGILMAAAMIIEPSKVRFMVSFPSPPDAFLIENKDVALYVHLLFALRERDLWMTAALFSSMLVDGFKYLERHWPRLVEDLAHGTLNPDLDLSSVMRDNLTEALGSGDPERAEEVRRELEKGPQGIMKRLWPQMKAIATIDSSGLKDGIMQTIGERLMMYTPVYPCTEMVLAININPHKEGVEEFLLNLQEGIFEFIPEDEIGNATPKTLLIDEVEKGKNYEIIITTHTGLYRYRVGDVLQITGFHQNCPMVRFMYRIGMILNLFGEKLDQYTFGESLKDALSEWSDVGSLSQYCVAESGLLSPLLKQREADRDSSSHYVLFLEMAATDNKTTSREIDLLKLAQKIDENIYSRHGAYRAFKDNKAIAPPIVYLLKPGSFDKLKDHILANSSATEIQFKMPKKLRTKGMAEVMVDNILR